MAMFRISFDIYAKNGNMQICCNDMHYNYAKGLVIGETTWLTFDVIK